MKHFVIVFIFCIAAFQVKGQSWAAPGATWYYDWSAWPWDFGFLKITKTGDTLIMGKTCDILKKTIVKYKTLDQKYDTVELAREYTYTSNKVVYNFRYNKFYVLYDFSAKPGDTWEAAPGWKACQDSTTIIKVDSTGWTIINGDSLKVLWTSAPPPGQYAFSDYYGKVIEKIGSIGYMLPEQRCVTDGSEGGPLRCYSDSSGWYYSTGIASSCDYIITGINENITSSEKAILYPNPSSENMKIILPSSFYSSEKEIIFRLISVTGMEVFSAKTSSGHFEIFKNDLSSGIYFYTIEQVKNGSLLQKGKLIFH